MKTSMMELLSFKQLEVVVWFCFTRSLYNNLISKGYRTHLRKRFEKYEF